MKKPQLSDFPSNKSHITIEEAKKRGLSLIVKQLEMDKKARKGLGLKSLQQSIKTPNKHNWKTKES